MGVEGNAGARRHCGGLRDLQLPKSTGGGRLSPGKRAMAWWLRTARLEC